jgi:hypothetical protein
MAVADMGLLDPFDSPPRAESSFCAVAEACVCGVEDGSAASEDP